MNILKIFNILNVRNIRKILNVRNIRKILNVKKIIYYGFLIIIEYYLQESYNLLLNMITIDGMITATNFIKLYINKNLTESQVIDESGKIYEKGTIDRYIYYILTYILYKIICMSIWIRESKILYISLILTIIPKILNKILRSEIYRYIERKKQNIIKSIVSKQIIKIIKIISEVYVKKKIEIEKEEIIRILDNNEKMIEGFKIVMKNSIIVIFMLYIKKYTNKLYYVLIKQIYNYKTGDILESYNTSSAKEKILYMIEKKKWEEILKPNIYKAIIHLYDNNTTETNNIQIIINNINNYTIKFISIWTISSFFENIYIIPIISLILLIYRIKKKSIKVLKKVIIIIITTIMSIYYKNEYLMLSLICQFGDILIINNVVYNIISYFYNEIKKKIYELILYNKKYNIYCISSYVYILLFKSIIKNDKYRLMHLIYISTINNNYKKNIIYIFIVLLSDISKYNYLHITYNTILIYTIIGNEKIIKNIYNKIKNYIYIRKKEGKEKKKIEKKYKILEKNIQNDYFDKKSEKKKKEININDSFSDIYIKKMMETKSINKINKKEKLSRSMPEYKKTVLINNYF